MEQSDILKHLEREKYRINKKESAGPAGLSVMLVIIEALSYIIKKLDGEKVIVEQVLTVEKPEKPEKPKAEPEKKKKKVDYGKIVALYKAGWSQSKIADEMGVSQNAIFVSLKRYNAKQEAGYIWDPEERKFIKR